jgi:hypothetical protein
VALPSHTTPSCHFRKGAAPRTHFYRRNDADILVFSVAERSHAEQFPDRFGGKLIDPKSRPKWSR